MTATIRSVRATRLRAGQMVLVESTTAAEVTRVVVQDRAPYLGLVLVWLNGRPVPEVFDAEDRVLVVDEDLIPA